MVEFFWTPTVYYDNIWTEKILSAQFDMCSIQVTYDSPNMYNIGKISYLSIIFTLSTALAYEVV